MLAANDLALAGSVPCGLMSLTATTCRWPLWAHNARPSDGGFYCGAESEGQTYCPAHQRQAGGEARPFDPRRVAGWARGVDSMARRTKAADEEDAPAAVLFDDPGEPEETRPRRVKPAERAAAVKSPRQQAEMFAKWRAKRLAIGNSAAAERDGVTGPAPTDHANGHAQGRRPGTSMSSRTAKRAPRSNVTAGETATPPALAPAAVPPAAALVPEAPFATRKGASAHYGAVRARLETAPPPAPLPVPAPAEPETLDTRLAAFAISDANRVAVRMVRLLVAGELPGGKLYINGPPGCGKSALLAAVRPLLPAGAVVIDDIESALATALQGFAGERLMLAAGQAAPPEIADGMLRDLVRGAVTVEIAPPDAALRRAIFINELARCSMSLPKALVSLICDQARDARWMVGIARTLAALHRADVVVSANVIEGLLRRPTDTPRPTLRRITRLVSARYGVTVTDLMSERRTGHVVRARQIAMFLGKRLTTCSLPQIGQHMGGRDHTTALHAVMKLTRLIDLDAAFAGEIAQLERTLARGEGAA